ncbi:hypothetical protein [Paeniglutamicibacter kerguelensis]|uniref:Uncharacterized protein n=1 Tax=Paeniglutamicibacter kerguelensis TaxID=254788 RepID=A0ABS4XI30_9MICC|nr:hypothetical protein [Paeniglutamicibacter kerguelensis]MBP2387908.1 hypothetical protein [Paeniglutamicibacter kerguelensis]
MNLDSETAKTLTNLQSKPQKLDASGSANAIRWSPYYETRKRQYDDLCRQICRLRVELNGSGAPAQGDPLFKEFAALTLHARDFLGHYREVRPKWAKIIVDEMQDLRVKKTLKRRPEGGSAWMRPSGFHN